MKRETIYLPLREFIVEQGSAMFDPDAINSAIDHWNEDRPPRGPVEFGVYEAAETIFRDMKKNEEKGATE